MNDFIEYLKFTWPLALLLIAFVILRIIARLIK